VSSAAVPQQNLSSLGKHLDHYSLEPVEVWLLPSENCADLVLLICPFSLKKEKKRWGAGLVNITCF